MAGTDFLSYIPYVGDIYNIGKSFGVWGNDSNEDAMDAIRQSNAEQQRIQKETTEKIIALTKELNEKGLAADKETRDLQIQTLRDLTNQALVAQQGGVNQSMAAQLGGAQLSSDLARWAQIQDQSQRLPYQAAQMSALSALPQLQRYMGLPAYNLPTSIDTSAPPQTNLYNLYAANVAKLNALQPANQYIQQPTARQQNIQQMLSENPNMPVTQGGNIPSMLPGAMPNIAQNASVLPTAAPTTEQVVQAAAEQGASPEQIKQLIYDFEALDPAMFNATAVNPAYQDRTVYNAENFFDPVGYQGYKPFAGIQGTLIDGTSAIRKGVPQTAQSMNNPDAYNAYLNSLKPLTEKLNRAQSTGDTANAARYQDIYNYYTGKPVSKDSTAFTYRPPTPTATQPAAAPVAPTQQAQTMYGSSAPTMTSDEIKALEAAGYTESAPQSFSLTPYTGPSFDYKQSPMYKQQLNEGETNVNRALSARGLSTGATGAMTLSDFYRKLEAEEAEKTYNRLLDQVKIGMGAPASTGNYNAGIQTASGLSNIANTLAASGQARSGLISDLGTSISNTIGATNPASAYAAMGTNLGNLYGQLGTNLTNLAGAQGTSLGQYYANQPDQFATGLSSLSSLYDKMKKGGIFGGGGTGTVISARGK